MRRFSASPALLLLLLWFLGSSPLGTAGQEQKSGPKTTGTASDSSGREICAAGRRLNPEQFAQCYACHGDVQAAFAQASHHPVNQGRMKCADCHDAQDPNGKSNVKPAGSQNATCTRCHAEMAGPFAHEHPVVKAEGCVSCHSPHGSPNAQLLNFSDVNTLCLQCHSATNASAYPHAVSAGPAPSKGAEACTSCHTQIHGSNASDIFFQ